MASIAVKAAMSEEDRLRADVYQFLAAYLLSRPSTEALSLANALTGDDTAFGEAFKLLAETASQTNETQAADEYDRLFIGLGRGELLPYGSYYLTGFLNEKPLAKLRSEMQRLGIARKDSVSEPEDHIGSLMEMMAGLITGRYGDPASIETQRAFFMTHIDPWAEHFFKDLEAATSSRFYQPLGRIGQLFIEIERGAFAMQ